MNINIKDQVIIDNTFSYLKVNERVYRIIVDRQYCNTEVVVGDRLAAAIDFGFGFGDIEHAIRTITDKPLLLFNTHCHIDHIGGNGQFKQPIYMGSEDIEAITHSMDSGRFRSHMWDDRVKRLGPESVAGMDKNEFLNRGVGTLIPCKEGDVFDLGGLTLRVINTPGHSAGGRTFFIEEFGIMYTGDAVFACTLCFGHGAAPREQHIASLRHLLEFPFTDCLSGHYIEAFDRDFIRHALRVAENADYETGIPLGNPIDARARVCFPPDERPAQEYIERIKNGDHGLDNEVWAIVLSN